MKLAKKAHALRYFDYLLALLGMFSSCYFAAIVDRLAETNLKPTTPDYVIGVIVLLLVVEATRRCVGNVMALLPVKSPSVSA